MVDSINSTNQIKSILPIDKSKGSSDQYKTDEVKPSKIVDEVNISEEALKLAQIEKTAEQASQQLSSDNSATLSDNLESLNKLV